jgi:hypothetical protein
VQVPGGGREDLRKDLLTVENVVYVGVFDRLFEYLEQVQAFIELGLIDREDVVLVSWWAEKVCRLTVDGKPVFRDYLARYDYTRVFELAGETPPEPPGGSLPH